MTKLKTDPGLLQKLMAAASHDLTTEQLRKQRVSFIMGSLKRESPITRDKIQKVLAAHEGDKSAA
ncbi:MAG: hypothetical protein ABSF67_12375 [Roseiarcus sp.]|jgi:hypothetical protein